QGSPHPAAGKPAVPTGPAMPAMMEMGRARIGRIVISAPAAPMPVPPGFLHPKAIAPGGIRRTGRCGSAHWRDFVPVERRRPADPEAAGVYRPALLDLLERQADPADR